MDKHVVSAAERWWLEMEWMGCVEQAFARLTMVGEPLGVGVDRELGWACPEPPLSL